MFTRPETLPWDNQQRGDTIPGPSAPAAFAHRGGAAHQPENSWPAFEYAVKLGYAYLETDARSTSDGALLAFHDATLDRVTDRTGQVGRLTYKQVSDGADRRI